MAVNEHVNKVIYGNVTLIDTSEVTVEPDKLAAGYTALDASGALITGTADVGGNKMYYGVCNSGSTESNKVVEIDGITELTTGLSIYVRFTYGQSLLNDSVYLNLNNLGNKKIRSKSSDGVVSKGEWASSEIINFCYNGSYWIIVDGAHASTTVRGNVMLDNDATSTNTDTALAANVLNDFSENTITGIEAFNANTNYYVGDKVRYGTKVYTCISDVSSGSSWQSSKWEANEPLQTQIDNISSDVSDVQALVTNIITYPQLASGATATDEELTGGTWIDGKPIYRIVMKRTLTLAANTAFGTIPAYETIVNCRCIVNFGTNTKPIPFCYYNNDNWELNWAIQNDGDIVIQAGSSHRISGTVHFIIEYTKPTE